MGKNERIGKWAGGYIRKTGAGPRYIIDRWAQGKHIHVSTRCATRDAAVKELARFEADPLRYVPGAKSPDGAVGLTPEMVQEHLAHQLESGVTRDWAKEMARCLCDWGEKLSGRDLRGLDLHKDLKPALSAWPKRKSQRIKAIKNLYRWLVEERGLIRANEDPTARLKVPQSTPAKWKRRRAQSRSAVQAVLQFLPADLMDILLLKAATGWHTSEVGRLARGGEIAPSNTPGVVAVLITLHKGGEQTRTALTTMAQLEVARRIQARGTIPNRMRIARCMAKACAAAGVPAFGFGDIRHSVATWAREAGMAPEKIAEALGHKSKSTTERFYFDLAEPVSALPAPSFTLPLLGAGEHQTLEINARTALNEERSEDLRRAALGAAVGGEERNAQTAEDGILSAPLTREEGS